jgi:hypothetical protein
MVMPIGRYIAWVGTSLLALLFLADWLIPSSSPEPTRAATTRPVIRIASVEQAPERVVFDTSRPTTAPPPTLFQDAGPSTPSLLQSYASVASPQAIAEVDQKKRKISKRQALQTAYHSPLASNPGIAGGNPATTVPPTRLSFIDFISKQLRRNLFSLN